MNKDRDRRTQGNRTGTKIRIGRFVICEPQKESVSIYHRNGEGGAFELAAFEEAVSQFFNVKF